MLSHLFGLGAEAPSTPRVRPSLDPASQLLAIHARLDALELACAGLWGMLKTKAGFTDEEIAQFIREADLKDGRLDGRSTRESFHCPSCGKTMLARAYRKCLWCGVELVDTPGSAGAFLS